MKVMEKIPISSLSKLLCIRQSIAIKIFFPFPMVIHQKVKSSGMHQHPQPSVTQWQTCFECGLSMLNGHYVQPSRDFTLVTP